MGTASSYSFATDELLPKIFFVNWFRKDDQNKYLWPGFGENGRILKWILERTNNIINYRITPIGLVPDIKKIDLKGLNINKKQLDMLFEVNKETWDGEIQSIKRYYNEIYQDKLPLVLKTQLEQLIKRYDVSNFI